MDSKKRQILNELHKYYSQDYHFADGHILGSMCTNPHPIAREAHIHFLDTNLGDPELFPGTKIMETKVLNFIKTLLNAPPTADALITSGGTEGNISAIWLAKLLSKKHTILIPENAHFSFKKISLLMDVKLNTIPHSKTYTLNINHIRKHINTDTAAIVTIAGSTDLGTIDPISEVSDLCNDEHIFLHVDAAFGGFVIPFLRTIQPQTPNFDFTLPGVSTVSIDVHKMGYSAIPLGALIMREKHWIDLISVESPCISTTQQAGILGTRSGGPVAAAYAVTKYLGLEGYQQLIQTCMETTRYAVNKIQEMGLQLVVPPTMNVIGVKLKQPDKIAKKLADKNWRVNVLRHLKSIRIVIMPQITKHIIDEFIPILKQVCTEEGEL